MVRGCTAKTCLTSCSCSRVRDLAVAAFAAVGGDGAGECAAAVDGLVPVVRHVGAAGGVVADDDDGDVGALCGGGGLLAEFGRCVVDFDVGAGGGGDAGERRDGVGRRAAVPVPVDGVGEWADDGDGFEFGLVEGQQCCCAFLRRTMDSRAVRREMLVGVAGVPGFGLVVCVDFRVRDLRGRVEEAELEDDFELAAEEGVELGFGDGAFFDGGVCFVLTGVEELVDAGVEAGDAAAFLSGNAWCADQSWRRAPPSVRDAVDVPLVDDDGFEDGIDGHGRAVPGVVAGHDAACAAVEEAHAEGDGVVLPEEAVVEVGSWSQRWSSLALARKCLRREAACQ